MKPQPRVDPSGLFDVRYAAFLETVAQLRPQMGDGFEKRGIAHVEETARVDSWLWLHGVIPPSTRHGGEGGHPVLEAIHIDKVELKQGRVEVLARFSPACSWFSWSKNGEVQSIGASTTPSSEMELATISFRIVTQPSGRLRRGRASAAPTRRNGGLRRRLPERGRP